MSTLSVVNNFKNIQVYARVRPLNAREKCMRSTEVIDVISSREILSRHSLDSKLTKKFTFDRTFGPESRQVDVYSTVVAPLIEEVLSGYNCTVFAYGQTGTGKTHTMVGTETVELKSSWEDDSEIGIIPRALSHLFDELRLMDLEFSMRISYLELYNEELCDLLSSDDATKIRIFDDAMKKGSVIIQGLEEIPVHSKDDVYKLLEKGKERRKTATTLMNAHSSRSHTVFSILVHIRENGIDGEEMLKIGKLNLVDLAGSENVSKAGNEKGIRIRETVNINQSLLTLGRVITALVERTPHVPYRESKLTRLLQESLGGRTKTSIIATISPGHKDIDETLSTLEYAHRAKNIQNKPEVNQKLTKKTVLKEYTEEIDKLKRDLMAARDKNGIYLADETYNEMTLKMDCQNRELNEKMLLIKAYKDELQNKEKLFNEVSLNLIEKTQELKRIENNLIQTEGILDETKKNLKTTKERYKEKKILLQSHIQTESKLTSQAKSILEMADSAVHDTHQLQNTIERRKDVDNKIHSACYKFSDSMRNHFEMMSANLENMQDQQKMYTKMLMEDLHKSIECQNKLFVDITEQIELANSSYKSQWINSNAIYNNIIKSLDELSDEHKFSLQNQIENLKLEDNKAKDQFILYAEKLITLSSIQNNKIESIGKIVTSQLDEVSSGIMKFANTIQQQIADCILVFENDAKEISLINKEIDNDHLLDEQQEIAINDFITKMNSIRKNRLTCNKNIISISNQLKCNKEKTTAQLQKSLDLTKSFCDKEKTDINVLLQKFDEQCTEVISMNTQNEKLCDTIKKEINECSQKNVTQFDSINSQETTCAERFKQLIKDYDADKEKVFLNSEKSLNDVHDSLQSTLVESIQRLKGHVAIETDFTKVYEKDFINSTKLQENHIENCIENLTNFNLKELKTYQSSGLTPSKRDYIYPRVLAVTSPHHKIVKRFKQENDCFDLETTTEIDEDIEEEEEPKTQINYTDLHKTEMATKEDCDIKCDNTLRPTQILNKYKMPATRSSQILSKNSLSSNLNDENKENDLAT